eukprot:366399-Chlamydomonas_euryale.AAC.4
MVEGHAQPLPACRLLLWCRDNPLLPAPPSKDQHTAAHLAHQLTCRLVRSQSPPTAKTSTTQ